MSETLLIIVRNGGSWESLTDGGEVYTGGSTTPFCVDTNISYTEFVHMLCERFNINLEELIITTKAIFQTVGPQISADINDEFSFQGFKQANSPTYVASMKGYCPLFVTIERRDSGVYCRQDLNDTEVLSHYYSPIVHVPSFRSSSESNTLRDTVAAMPTQFQLIGQRDLNNNDAELSQNVDLYNVDYFDHQHEREQQQEPEQEQEQEQEPRQEQDYHTFETDISGNEFVGGGRNNVENTNYGNVYKSTGVMPPSSSNQYFRYLPPIPPAIIMSDDTSSSTRDGDVSVGQIFRTKQELRDKLGLMALKNHFEIKVSKSSTDRFEAKCRGEGCKWRIRATKPRNDEYFRVTGMYTIHSCQNDLLQDTHRQASTRLIGQLIKDKFTDANRIYTPRNIRDDIQREYGVQLSYSKTWRSKKEALRLVSGDPSLSYKLLPLYCHVLGDKNPGSMIAFEKDDKDNFMYFFMAIGSCIRGFRNYIRPVIAVDGTFLKGKYRGTLFLAAALDGNDQIFPIAFGIADSENDASWEWFFVKLREAIYPIEDLVFISDRHNSIQKGIYTVFPDAVHGFCTYHISGNVKSKYKMRARQTDTFMQCYFQAAKIYEVNEFNECMASLRTMHEEAANYLENEIGVHKWARSQFPARRYDMMTTNITESMNALLRNARSLPIVALADYIRSVLQRWFYERRELAMTVEGQLTEAVQKKIDDQIELSRTMTVDLISRGEYEVKDHGRVDIVDIREKRCTCRLFDMQQLPCAHALAVCRHARLSYIGLCSHFYTTEALVAAYAEPIYPVGNEIDWDVPSELRKININPPIQ